MMATRPITGELRKLQDYIEKISTDYGLTFFPVIFEECDYDVVNILAAQGGFPSRYPHWRFGMDYDQLSKGYAYGLQKIYEMVINTDPVYAYLLTANHMVDQKTVIAHVYGHADFFKNNLWFSTTDRKMMDVMANHGTKIRRYIEKYGQDRVETFIDKVLSIENLIDVNNLFETSELARERRDREIQLRKEIESSKDGRSQALKSYMRSKERGEKNAQEGEPIAEEDFRPKKFPEKSVRDVMEFLMDHAPIEEWESDIIGILRDEAYYFLPQRMTKIMNEGWASYWHSKMMTEDVLNSSEIVDFCDHNAGVLAMNRQNINPYKIGIELFVDIEHRWDTGKFGKEYNECSEMSAKESWDKKLGLGREKIFEVRKTHNDVTFIDEFLTPEFCERQKIFTYKYNPRTGRYEIDSREFEAIKSKLLSSLTNFGQPVIEVEDANFGNRGELLLNHCHYGVDLDIHYAADTLKNIFAVWKRPVNIRTQYDDKWVIFHYDGKEMKSLAA
jgi:stage V sporulation protein R